MQTCGLLYRTFAYALLFLLNLMTLAMVNFNKINLIKINKINLDPKSIVTSLLAYYRLVITLPSATNC